MSSVLEGVVRRLRERASWEDKIVDGESEAEFQSRLAYQQALQTVAQAIEEALEEGR